MIMTICRICGKDVDIRTHIKVHKLTSKEYYDRCIKKENEGICPICGKEHWNKDNDEIEKSCDEWINICLNKYNCKKYLFVVDKTEKYKNNIIETLENKSHFGKNNEYVILIKKE